MANTKNYMEQGGASWVIGGDVRFNGTIYGLQPGKVFYVDPRNGSDTLNDGLSMGAALKTIKAAYDLCTTNCNDVVAVIGDATENALAAALPWAKSYTHLIGLSADIPGVGQRCRITGSAALDLLYLIDFQGNGCIVKNIQFFNNYDSTAAHGAVKVTGNRNYFENCFFAGMGGCVTHTGTYDLWLQSDENVFKRCTIGLHTMANGVANSHVLISNAAAAGQRCKFIDCEFLNWSTVTTTAMIRITSDVTTEGFVLWLENCLFDNLLGGATMANAIEDAATETHHQIVLRGYSQMVGITGWTDQVTYAWGIGATPNNGFGVSLNPAA